MKKMEGIVRENLILSDRKIDLVWMRKLKVHWSRFFKGA